MSLMDPAIAAPGAALTGLILCEVVILIVLGIAGKLYVPLRKTVFFVLVGLFISALLRFTWWILKMTVRRSAADHVMNRLSWLFFTLTFMLLLFGWIEAVHSKFPPPSDRFVPTLKWIFLILAGFISVFVIVFLIVWGATANGTNEGNAIYEVNILFLASLQALLSIAFLIYGSVLMYRVFLARKYGLSAEDERHAARYRTALIKILVTMCVMTACFLVRFVFLVYRPATDTIPAVVEMFIIISTSESRRKLERERSGYGSNSGNSSQRSTARLTKGFRKTSVPKKTDPSMAQPLLLSDDEEMERPALGTIYSDEVSGEDRTSHASAVDAPLMNYEGMGSGVETQEVPVMDYSGLGATDGDDGYTTTLPLGK